MTADPAGPRIAPLEPPVWSGDEAAVFRLADELLRFPSAP